MNYPTSTMRALHALAKLPKNHIQPKCLLRFAPALPSSSRQLSFSQRKFNKSDSPEDQPQLMDAIALHRLQQQTLAAQYRRAYLYACGFVVGMVGLWITSSYVELPPDNSKPSKLEAPKTRRNDPLVMIGRERKVVVQRMGEEPEEIEDVVETGTSTVPTFPRVLEFADTAQNKDVGSGTTDDGLVEYQLLGLGIRTVSFLGIQVYVVGMYIATDDIATFQEALIRTIDPIATTLVAGEKTKLKEKLLDAEKGEEVWNEVLRDTHVRTLLRIVPTRDTDFGHLRDGWVRSITAKAKKNNDEFGDEAFGASVNDFKALFRKGGVPKRKELLLARNEKGVLAVWYDDGKEARRLGDVQDERISRAVWLNYLGGKTVASEPARKSVVDGVMEFVERPVGTVATQVHV